MSHRTSVERIGERVRKIRFVIESLDRCRVGERCNLAKVGRAFRELKLKDAPHSWEEAEEAVRRIWEIPTKAPIYGRLERFDRLAGKLAVVGLVLVLASVAVLFTELPLIVYIALLLSSGVLINAAYFLRIYVQHKIIGIYSEREDELERLGRPLKETIDYLLVKAKGEVRKLRAQPGEFRLRLRFADYENIRVIKRPSALRGSYLVSLS